MQVRRATYEILQDVIQTMNHTITGKEYTTWIDNTDGTFTLQTCSTLWVRQGMSVTIDGVNYKVVSVNNNSSITITAASAPVVTSFDIQLPNFMHGTIIFVNEEVTANDDLDAEFPMIFLHEPTTETVNRNPMDREGMRSECDLYFLATTNLENWKNADHYALAVAPMRNMANAFVDALEVFMGVIQPLPDYTMEDRVRWGRANINGYVKELINANLSGTSLKISPQFEKTICTCEC